jgi:hypothetical protein
VCCLIEIYVGIYQLKMRSAIQGIRKIGHEGTFRWAILAPSSEMFLLEAAHRFLLLDFIKKSMSSIYTNIGPSGLRALSRN